MLRALRMCAWAGLFALVLGVVHDAIPHEHGALATHNCEASGMWDAVLHLADHHAQGVPCDDHHDLKQWSSERPSTDVDATPDVDARLHDAVDETGEARCALAAVCVDPDAELRRRERHPCGRRGPPTVG
jgi:hypothetical protein